MDGITAPLAIIQAPNLTQPWRAIPDVGFIYDRVIAIKHHPVNRHVARIWRDFANRTDLCEGPLFNAIADYVSRSSHATPEAKAEAGRKLLAEFRKKFAGRVSGQLFSAVSGMLTTVKHDYGHSADILRCNGIPVAAYHGARVLSFDPFYLNTVKVGGKVSYRISDAERALMMLRYDRVVPAALSNDDDLDITSCAIFKIDEAQMDAAFDSISSRAEGRFYHVFAQKQGPHGEKTLNCATNCIGISDDIGLETPAELRPCYLPSDMAAAIESLAKRQEQQKIPGQYYVSRAAMRDARERRFPKPVPAHPLADGPPTDILAATYALMM